MDKRKITGAPAPSLEGTAPGSNGASRKRKHHAYAPDAPPVPPVSVRALVEERNWTALAGLGLLVMGGLILLGDAIDIRFNLWAVLLLGVGAWLVTTGWQRYEQAGYRWDDTARNRVIFGTISLLVGLLGLLQLDWWGLLLLAIAFRLGRDAQRRVGAAAGRWTLRQRAKMALAVFIGAIGLLNILSLGSAGPLLLILIGIGLFIERTGSHIR